MKLERLHFTAWGAFQDKEVVFDVTRRVHVIYGPNEAGKSTLHRGLTAFLFGMNREPLAMKESQIRGMIHDVRGARLTLVRAKKTKASLLFSDGTAAPQTVFGEVLAQQTRAHFESVYALDHTAFREGGQALLAGKGEVGKALFQASLGGRRLVQLKERLEKEAEALYGPRATTRPVNEAFRAYLEAQGKTFVGTVEPEAVEKQEQHLGHLAMRMEQTLNTLRRERAVLAALDTHVQKQAELGRLRARIQELRVEEQTLEGERLALAQQDSKRVEVPAEPVYVARTEVSFADVLEARVERDVIVRAREHTPEWERSLRLAIARADHLVDRLLEQRGQEKSDQEAMLARERARAEAAQDAALAAQKRVLAFEGKVQRARSLRAELEQRATELEATLATSVVATDRDAVLGQIAELESEHARLIREHEGVRAGLAQLRIERDAAAETHAEAQGHFALARGLAQAYVKKRIAIQLLDDEVRRFQSANQAPILAHASRFLGALTLGRFERIGFAFAASGEPHLRCFHAGDTDGLPVEALSEGTLDQLYCALQFGALCGDTPCEVPLLLDDTFVHFDDARTHAALHLLVEVSSAIETFYFTHHERVFEMAQQIGGIDALRL